MSLKIASLLAILALINTFDVTVTVNNLCDKTLLITTTSDNPEPTAFTDGLEIDSQQSASTTFDESWLGVFYANNYILSGVELGVHFNKTETNYYRIIFSNNYPYAIEVVPPEGCKTSICSAFPCPLPKVNCESDGEYAINFCPSTTTSAW